MGARSGGCTVGMRMRGVGQAPIAAEPLFWQTGRSRSGVRLTVRSAPGLRGMHAVPTDLSDSTPHRQLTGWPRTVRPVFPSLTQTGSRNLSASGPS